MKSRHLVVASIGAAAIFAAALLLREHSSFKLQEARQTSSQADPNTDRAQELIRSKIVEQQQSTPEERERKIDEVVKSLDSPTLLERRRELVSIKAEFLRASRNYDSLRDGYSKSLLASSNPESDVGLRQQYKSLERQMSELQTISLRLKDVTALFNDELAKKALAKFSLEKGDSL